MRFSHLCIVARDADRLAAFYRTVFECEERRPGKVISGANVSRGIGLPVSGIYSIWLSLPAVESPFLEIQQYEGMTAPTLPPANQPGYRHMSFMVGDIRSKSAEVVAAGGTKLGEITNVGTAEQPFLAVYMRDPEGNVIEIEEC